MSSKGLSRVISVIIAVTGGVGPTGPTGATGFTGNFATGPLGPRGIGIIGATYNSIIDGVTFTLFDKTTIGITGIKGNTGNASSASPPGISYVGSGITPLVNSTGVSGYTLFFRGVTFAVGLSGSISANTIFIQENTGYTGSFDENKLLYVKYSQTQSLYYLDSADKTAYKNISYSGTTYSELTIISNVGRDILDSNNFNYSIGTSANAYHTGLTMTIDSAVYGITGLSFEGNSNVLYPYLKYRASYFDSAGSSGATFSTISFLEIGPYNKTIKLTEKIGSCCFECDSCNGYSDGRNCIDYVSKTYCDSVSGRWSLENCYTRQSTYDCYLRRACCVNGRCVNATRLKCLQMKGSFCEYKVCGVSYNCDIPCIEPQPVLGPTVYCCCKDGIGTELTDPALCVGKAIIGNCESVNCRSVENTGACCLQNGSCVYLTKNECAFLGGVYKGTGVTCSSTTCCTP
jgi:hypothetical protein